MNTQDQMQDKPGTHEEWMELCALATANALTDEERARLEEHLAGCAECRKICRQYSALALETVPSLAGDYVPSGNAASTDTPWDIDAMKTRMMAKADAAASSRQATGHIAARPSKRRTALLAIGSGIAAAVVFALGLGGGYVLSKRSTPAAKNPQIATDVAEVNAQKDALNRRLTAENARLETLETQSDARGKELAGLHDQLDAMNAQAARSAKDKSGEDQTLATAVSDEDALQAKLRETQQNYDAVQQELVQLRTQRQQDQLHYASLEYDVTDLRQKLRAAESRENDATQYLASDRDIRELMGARQLYIADVTDMDTNGEPRKPFGRVFYTKGKQLIFYAFDLDQQPGVKQASTFQAWAHEGSDRTRAVSLGIFYVDSEANRRWALKTDDPKVLAQINSVFVTVEPKGGSQKPTTKPLLYAYLKTEAPNHP
jgi:anti-sigma-K factor RskA